jgi:chromosome segregation ATPase
LAAAERKVKSAVDVVEGTLQEVNEVQTECHALRGEIVDAERHLRETKERLEEAERRLVEAKQADKIAKKELTGAKNQRNRAEALLHQTTSSES